jgi:hypothetical protein
VYYPKNNIHHYRYNKRTIYSAYKLFTDEKFFRMNPLVGWDQFLELYETAMCDNYQHQCVEQGSETGHLYYILS